MLHECCKVSKIVRKNELLNVILKQKKLKGTFDGQSPPNIDQSESANFPCLHQPIILLISQFRKINNFLLKRFKSHLSERFLEFQFILSE